MITTQTFRGYFFLPESSNKTVAGELTYTDEQLIRLYLYGSFYEDETVDFLNADKYQEAIWGYLFNGEKISLVNCYAITREVNFSGYSTAIYNAEVVFKGNHVRNLQEKSFIVLYAEFDHLYDWLQVNGTRLSFKNGINSINISYEKPDNILFRINDNYDGEFIFTHNMPGPPDYNLSPNCFFKIIPHENRSFEELRSILWDFQTMLSFLIFSKARITSFSLRSPSESSEPNHGTKLEKEIFVFYKQSHTQFSEANYYKYLLTYDELSTSFEKFVANWYRLSAEISPIIEILYNQMGELSQFTESTFLSIVQAVEAFHRRNIQQTAQLKRTDKERKDIILSQVQSKENVQWLKDKLAYSFEPSLKMRLKQLFEATKDLLFINSNEEVLNQIIRQIVDTRNYYTHYDNKLEAKKIKPKLMRIYSNLLKNVLALSILRSLNISETLMMTAVKENMKFRFKS